MRIRNLLVCAAVTWLLLAACREEQRTNDSVPDLPVEAELTGGESGPSEPAAGAVGQPTTTTGIVLSEVLLGMPGNNNIEFIELYNAGSEPAALDGHSLWYLLEDGEEERLVHAWDGPAGISAHGHLLLARPGHDFGVASDADYDVPLVAKGALILRDAAGELVDQVGWGNAPSTILNPAPAPEPGLALERKPGGEAGNNIDSDNDAEDFALTAVPTPQNNGSPAAPDVGGALMLTLDLPEQTPPGEPFAATMQLANDRASTESRVDVYLILPAGLTLVETPASASFRDGVVHWPVEGLAPGASATLPLKLQAPWNYFTALFSGHYAEGAESGRFYGAPGRVEVGGGPIPIAVARELEGEEVTVAGVATMYTGGFFAGSSGVKFYLEDETGGIQVYVAGGAGEIEVGLGDRVQVTGGIEIYRDSLELTPDPTPEDIVILSEGDPSAPVETSLAVAREDPALLGSLVSVAGYLAEITENSFDHTMDLLDSEGNALLVLLEETTNVPVEPLELGGYYRVTGVLELYSGQWQLKPRIESDFERIFPPELRIELDAPDNVAAGDVMTVSLTVFNDTTDPLTGVRVTSSIADLDVAAVVPLDDGSSAGDTLFWMVPDLAAGEFAVMRYTVQAAGPDGQQLAVAPASATANEWPEPATAGGKRVFVGAGIPIWAIQGEGDRSPYVRSDVQTDGVVTGVFPELGGFWIQELETDDNPLTSAGVFVRADDPERLVQAGDLVTVTARVREVSGQTTLDLAGPEALGLLASTTTMPEATELDPPVEQVEADAYYESLEGMLVQVSGEAVVVQPTNQYGEYALVRADSGLERVFEGDPTGRLIFVDDGTTLTHEDASTLAYAVSSGDRVGQLLGPLAFTFDQFKIEPVITPTVQSRAGALPTLPEPALGEFTIATFNAENLFDADLPHPAEGGPSSADYELRLAKTANAIAAMGFPTIVALQEIENVGVLDDLAVTQPLAAFGYVSALIEGFDGRGIDVGYLVRSDQASLAGFSADQGPNELFARPPLLMTVTLHLAGGDQTLYLLNNHFLSLSGGEEATETQRTAQAAWNVTLVEQVLAREPEALIAVVGDLNSFYQSPPIDRLRDAGLRHVYEFSEPERLYTYIFQGESETLDHILVTPALYELLVDVTALHINADFPPPDPDDPSARRSSDHDPLVARFGSR